jgi:acyl-CoA synthetase (NDP forming)
VIGDARHDRYEAAIRSVMKDPNVDGVVVILTPQAMTDIRETGEVVANVARSMKLSPWTAKPILASFMGIVDVSEGVKILEDAGVPHYTFPEAAVRSLATMAEYQIKWLSRPRTEVKNHAVQKDLVRKIIDRIRAENRSYIPQNEAMKIFAAYGMPILESRLATKEEEALKAADEIGYPIVLKIVSPAIVHKLDAGGVAVNIQNGVELSRAFRTMYAAAESLVGREKIWGIEVQKMADKGIEVLLGAKRDPVFGPVVVFGMGGTFVEVFKDAAFRVAPLRALTITHMIESTKAGTLLKGYRGKPGDMDKVVECVGRLSQLVLDFPEIVELDINPMIVYPSGNGARIVDGRIVLA